MIARERVVRSVEVGAWLAAFAMAALAVTSWRTIMHETTSDAVRAAAPPRQPTFTSAESLSIHAEVVAANDPFRVARRPSPVAYRPELEGAPPPPPAPPKPPLSVSGIIGGPPWQAVLEGMPGRDGPLVVSAGDRIGDLTIRSVRRDTVVVSSSDTTWKLSVRRPWK